MQELPPDVTRGPGQVPADGMRGNRHTRRKFKSIYRRLSRAHAKKQAIDAKRLASTQGVE